VKVVTTKDTYSIAFIIEQINIERIPIFFGDGFTASGTEVAWGGIGEILRVDQIRVEGEKRSTDFHDLKP
jgi:hypothetical protein